MYADAFHPSSRLEPEGGLGGAVALALGLHVLVILMLYIGWEFAPHRQTGSPGGGGIPMVEASLAISDADIAAAETALANSPIVEEILPEAIDADETTSRLPQPIPETRPQDAVAPPQPQAQDFVTNPDQYDQVRATADAIARETEARAQEARQRQSQVDLNAENRQQIAQSTDRLSAEEQRRQARIAELQRQRQAAEREAQQKARQLERLRQAAQTGASSSSSAGGAGAGSGAGGTGTDRTEEYRRAIQQAVVARWTRPESVPLGQRCTVRIVQLPGGRIIDVQVASNCPYSEAGKRSLENAIRAAEPLPYRGFENEYNRNLNFHFEAQDR